MGGRVGGTGEWYGGWYGCHAGVPPLVVQVGDTGGGRVGGTGEWYGGWYGCHTGVPPLGGTGGWYGWVGGRVGGTGEWYGGWHGCHTGVPPLVVQVGDTGGGRVGGKVVTRGSLDVPPPFFSSFFPPLGTKTDGQLSLTRDNSVFAPLSFCVRVPYL